MVAYNYASTAGDQGARISCQHHSARTRKMTEVRWIEPVDTHTILMITIIGIALVCDRTAPMHQLVARMGRTNLRTM